MFDRKPEKIMNAQAVAIISIGLILGVMVRRFFWTRFEFDPNAQSLEFAVTSPEVAALLVGSIAFGAVGGLLGIVLGWRFGAHMPIPPMVATMTVVLFAIITLKYQWDWSVKLLFLLGYLLFWLEMIVLYFFGKRMALDRKKESAPTEDA